MKYQCFYDQICFNVVRIFFPLSHPLKDENNHFYYTVHLMFQPLLLITTIRLHRESVLRIIFLFLLKKLDSALAMQTPLLHTDLIHILGRTSQKPSITVQNCRDKSGVFEDLNSLKIWSGDSFPEPTGVTVNVCMFFKSL